MTGEQKEQFRKFKGDFTRWMYYDAELALYLAQTQFLVAMGLFNYIEILGAFRIGYFKRDNDGLIESCHRCSKKNIKGCTQCINGQLKTTSTDRFKNFFSYLGKEYKDLSETHSEMYKELRCGMAHEFLPSERPFTIYHAGEKKFTKEQIDSNDPTIDAYADNLPNKLDNNSIANCGVVLTLNNGKEVWQIFVPKLAADFRRSVKRFIVDVENDLSLHRNFFETASQINFKNL